MESFKIYSRTDRRFIIQKVNDHEKIGGFKYLELKITTPTFSEEDRLAIDKEFIVVSTYGKNPNKFQVHTRTIKNKVTAINELEFHQESNNKKSFYLYEIIKDS